MRRQKTPWLCVAVLMAGVVGPLFGAEFAPPAEGPAAFRRDRIPLEVDTMVRLSKNLERLARGMNARTPAEMRGVAQMLALALALDPGNAQARNLMVKYRNGRREPAGGLDRMEAGRSEVRRMVAWLETAEAGSDAQALAACLKDVLRISGPTNAGVGARAEQGAWAGWIPDVSAYETKTVAAREKTPEGPVAGAESSGEYRILLQAAEVRTPLWQVSEESARGPWILMPGPLRMTARKVKSHSPEEPRLPEFSIKFGNGENSEAFRPLVESLKVLLENQHGPLPRGVGIQITGKEFEKAIKAGKRQSISAAAAVLASSAITGREPEAIIIGQIDANGAFNMPTRFWDQLLALGEGGGRRLVLPAAAAAFMPSILAMEKPEFFFGYEVVLAADFPELLEMSEKEAREPLASASRKFREIRERAGNLGVRSYIDNSFVKQRLAAVLQDLPSHVSAKMLLAQASGSRPTRISRKVLAAELRSALEWVPRIRTKQDIGIDSKLVPNAGEVYEACRAEVDGLERYVEKDDRNLWDQALEVALSIRNLDRASRARGDSYVVEASARVARGRLTELHDALVKKLAEETGDQAAAGGL